MAKLKKLPVTVAMVMHNEEAVIERALRSCSDIVDEIIIVHDGPCTDKSIKIAKSYKAKVFSKPRAGAPEPHRPFTFSQARNSWILQLDADEYLDDDFRRALPKMIKRKVTGYTVNWVEEFGGTRFTNMIKEVLFRKEKIYFIGAPNEYVKPVVGEPPLRFEPVHLTNSSSIGNYYSWGAYTRKYKKFARIQAKLYAGPFSAINKWNYSENEWDKNTKWKIASPILLGIFGMNLKYIFTILRNIVGIRTGVSTKASIHLLWYNTFLYWNVWKEKKSQRFTASIAFRSSAPIATRVKRFKNS